MVGCANKHWIEDLLLLSREFLQERGEGSHLQGQYEIEVYDEIFYDDGNTYIADDNMMIIV